VQLIADVLPTNASNKTLTWTSSSTAVATVNSSGVVTGIASTHHKTIVGGQDVYDCDTTATITVRANDGSQKSATCAVSVYPAAYFGENDQKPVTPTLNSDAYRAKTLRDKFLAVAATQVGYHNGKVSQYCHAPSFSTADPSGWVKYTSYYNSGIQYDSNIAWCASFVSWCAEISGSGSGIFRTRQAKTMWENTGGKLFKSAANSTNVKAGDLVYISKDGTPDGIHHVGIVSVDYDGNGTLSTVDGNTQNGYVANTSRGWSTSRIYGFNQITY
jgi:hypothetical protein